MSFFDKAQPFLVLLSVLMGLAMAQSEGLSHFAPSLITPLLAIMLYATFLSIPLRQFGRVLQNFKVALASLITNFAWTPLFAWGLGALFLRDSPDLWVGLVMLMVTPCTDWYLVFTGVARGDVALATALLPLNLILQILLLPLYLLLFAGTLVELQPLQLFRSLVWVLLVPLFAAAICRGLLLQMTGKARFEQILTKISVLQIFSLNLAIVAIFAANGTLLIQHPELLLKLLVPVMLFFVINFALAGWIGRWLQFSYEEFACFSCTTLARNSPLSLAIAASTFPHRPLISLSLVIGPLIELPVMVLISQLLLMIRRRGQWQQ
jgi:ACR3 family arsenite efflux pump ArsB